MQTWLADALRAGGLPVVEEPGWKTRGRPGDFSPIGVLVHHTAGAASGDLPSKNYVISGSSSLPGPLSQLMLSRSGKFHVIAAGRANHAGSGAASWVPGNAGNTYLIGIEAESVGTRDDWTAAQRANYPKGVAALLRHMGKNESRCIAHKEWAPSRKSDPAFWNMNDFRAAVRAHLNNAPQGDDDMALSPEDRQWMLQTFAKRVDLGFARDQIMSHLGKDPNAAPVAPADRPNIDVARRVDVGLVRDLLVSGTSEVRDLLQEVLERLSDNDPQSSSCVAKRSRSPVDLISAT